MSWKNLRGVVSFNALGRRMIHGSRLFGLAKVLPVLLSIVLACGWAISADTPPYDDSWYETDTITQGRVDAWAGGNGSVMVYADAILGGAHATAQQVLFVSVDRPSQVTVRFKLGFVSSALGPMSGLALTQATWYVDGEHYGGQDLDRTKLWDEVVSTLARVLGLLPLPGVPLVETVMGGIGILADIAEVIATLEVADEYREQWFSFSFDATPGLNRVDVGVYAKASGFIIGYGQAYVIGAIPEIHVTADNDLVHLQVFGPSQASANSTADYSCFATYAQGESLEVTKSPDITWSVDSSNASISPFGSLEVGNLPANEDTSVAARYIHRLTRQSPTIKTSEMDVELLRSGGGGNSCPSLNAGRHIPSSIDTTTNVVFEVEYRDDDGDYPVSSEVVVDGNTRIDMSVESVERDDGVYIATYRSEGRKFSTGTHSYAFEFSDSSCDVTKSDASFSFRVGSDSGGGDGGKMGPLMEEVYVNGELIWDYEDDEIRIPYTLNYTLENLQPGETFSIGLTADNENPSDASASSPLGYNYLLVSFPVLDNINQIARNDGLTSRGFRPAKRQGGKLFEGYEEEIAETCVIAHAYSTYDNWTTRDETLTIDISPPDEVFGQDFVIYYQVGMSSKESNDPEWWAYDPTNSPHYDCDGMSAYKLIIKLPPISQPNRCPVLSEDQIRPEFGATPEVDIFFYLSYSDLDGDPANTATVVVDETTYAMHLLAGQANDGVYVSDPLRFAVGSHSYYYAFSDNECTEVLPQTGVLAFVVEEIVNRKPTPAVQPYPSQGAIGVENEPLLSWSPSTDPDGDLISYSIYFGTNQDLATNPLYGPVGVPEFDFTAETGTSLQDDTVYYWMVLSSDGKAAVESPPWYFATGGTNSNCPVLSNSDVQPDSGTPSTDFFFFVHYVDADGDQPSEKNVVIDGQEYAMHPLQGGLYSSDALQFPVGWHKAHFEFSDGTCIAREPSGENDFLNFEVKANQCPVLSNGSVAPPTGTDKTKFVFSIHYFDSEFNVPVLAEVVVDETTYDLFLASGDAHNGTYESASLTFSDGTYDYFFQFDDGQCGNIQQTQEESFTVGDGGNEDAPEGLPFSDTFDSQINENVWAYVHPPSHRSSIASGRLFIDASNDWTQGSGVATKETFPNDTTVQFEVKVTSLGCSNGGQTILQLRDGDLDDTYHRPTGPNQVSIYANCDGNLYVRTSGGANENIGPYSTSTMKQITFQFTPTQTVVTYEGVTKMLPLVLGGYHIWYGGHIHDAYYDNLSVVAGTDPGQQFCPTLSDPDEDETSPGSYTFSVHYQDGNGDAPTTKDLYLDGQRFETTLSTGEVSNGTYIYGPVVLNEGTQHEYYFEFADGECGEIQQTATQTFWVGGSAGLPFEDTFDSQINESVWAYVHPPNHRASIASGRLFIDASNDWTQGSGVATRDTFPNDTTVKFEVKVTSLGCSNGGQTLLQLRDGELDGTYHRPTGPNYVSIYASCDGNLYLRSSRGANENLGPYSNSVMRQITFQFTPTQTVVTYEGVTKTLPLILDDYHIWYGGHIHDAYYDNLTVDEGTDPDQQFCPVLSDPDEDGTAGAGYTFTVHYRDADGDAPTTKKLFLDGQVHDMALGGGTASDGTYTFGPVLLDEGTQHEYYFEFADGECGEIQQTATQTFWVGGEIGLPFHDTFDSQIDESVWAYVHPPSHRASIASGRLFIDASNDWTQGCGVATKDTFPNDTTVQFEVKVTSLGCSNGGQTLLQIRDGELDATYHRPVGPKHVSIYASCDGNLYLRSSGGANENMGAYSTSTMKQITFQFTPAQTVVTYEGVTKIIPLVLDDYHIWYGGHIHDAYYDNLSITDGTNPPAPPPPPPAGNLPFQETFSSTIDESVWAYVHPPSHRSSIVGGQLLVNAQNDWTQGCGVATKDTFPNDTTVQFEMKVTYLGCSNGGQTLLQIRDGILDATYHRPVGPNYVYIYASCDGNLYLRSSGGADENLGSYSSSAMKQITFQFTPTETIVTYEGVTKIIPLVLDDYHIWYGGHIHDAYYDNLSITDGTVGPLSLTTLEPRIQVLAMPNPVPSSAPMRISAVGYEDLLQIRVELYNVARQLVRNSGWITGDDVEFPTAGLSKGAYVAVVYLRLVDGSLRVERTIVFVQ